MKNTTENLKPEQIYLNLDECSEYDKIEVIAMLPQPQDIDDYVIIYDYKYLIFDDDIERNCWWVVDETRISNKTEVNLKQFKEIIGAKVETSVEINSNWIKIESKKDLPKEQGYYFTMRRDGTKIEIKHFFFELEKEFMRIATHYKPIIFPSPPTN